MLEVTLRCAQDDEPGEGITFGGSKLANIKSQIKRNRQNEKRRVKNRVYRGAARTSVKKARAALEANSLEPSTATVHEAVSLLDRGAQKGVLHKNNAARRKSRLMRQLAAKSPAMVTAAAPTAETPVAAESETPKEKAARKPARRSIKTTGTKKTTRTTSKKTRKE